MSLSEKQRCHYFSTQRDWGRERLRERETEGERDWGRDRLWERETEGEREWGRERLSERETEGVTQWVSQSMFSIHHFLLVSECICLLWEYVDLTRLNVPLLTVHWCKVFTREMILDYFSKLGKSPRSENILQTTSPWPSLYECGAAFASYRREDIEIKRARLQARRIIVFQAYSRCQF